MDIVLGVSMAPTTVGLLVIEGQNADGVTVEQDEFEVGAAGDSATAGAVDQVIAAIRGTREGAVEGGHQLTSTGVTWTDPAEVGALREAIAPHEVGSVMLVSPLLAAAALAQTVGHALGYEHIAMLFVEPESTTLAVVDVADGSIVDLHRHPVATARQGASQGAIAAELATMVASLATRGSWADGVFLIGCGTDIVPVKPALEAATSLVVTAPEEPDMALARGAALASANAPLFASSTAALAYALDPGTGEMNPRALSPTYLDVCGNADLGAGALAYSAVEDDGGDETRRRPRASLVAGSALAAISAIVAGALVVSLTSDRPTSAVRHNPRVSAATPGRQVPAQLPSKPPEAQLPAPSPPPPAPTTEVAAPPPAPPPAEKPAPPAQVNRAPATPVYRAPTRAAPRYVPTP
ncbi:MAG: hypothetical protein WAO15_08730, partial [Mycobacterium sp.]